MTTHKQYLAMVKLAFEPERWWNAVWLTTGKRYALSLEAAEKAIQTVAHRYPNDPGQRVTESHIRVREVTEWEDVTETTPE